jgi:DNA-binding beta-propeller fold protein YncE
VRPDPALLRPLLRILAALLVAGCAPPSYGRGGAESLLYVANAADGTVTRLDGRSGRPAGPPLPGGPAPSRLVVGAEGRLLLLPAGSAANGTLTHVGPRGDRPVVRTIALEAGARPLHLAADGGRYAAAAYVVGGAPDRLGVPAGPCRLALVDLLHGTVAGVHRPCAPGEEVTGLALVTDSAGTVAYLALWRRGAGRLVAVDAAGGAVLAARPMARPTDLPSGLVLAPAPGGAGPRLYAVVEALDPDETRPEAAAGRWASALSWRLLGLHPTTLAVESDFPLPGPAPWLAVAPDGRDAYALGAGSRLFGTPLQRIDLDSGAATVLGRVPGLGVGGLAVTRERLYVPDTEADRLWVADRNGRPLGHVPTGRRPLGIAVGPGSGAAVGAPVFAP